MSPAKKLDVAAQSELHAQMDILAARRDRFDDKIDDICQKVSFGLAALPFAYLLTENRAEAAFFARWKSLLLVAALFGIVAILADYLQRLLAFSTTVDALNSAKYEFNPKSFAFRYSKKMMWLKQGAAFTGALVFLVIVALAIWAGQ